MADELWTDLLIRWVNCCLKSSPPAMSLNTRDLLEILNKYNNDINLNRTLKSVGDLEPFLTCMYPAMRTWYLSEEMREDNKTVITASLLLLHCVTNSQGAVDHDICSTLTPIEQQFILVFCEELVRNEVNINTVQGAIKDACKLICKEMKNTTRDSEQDRLRQNMRYQEIKASFTTRRRTAIGASPNGSSEGPSDSMRDCAGYGQAMFSFSSSAHQTCSYPASNPNSPPKSPRPAPREHNKNNNDYSGNNDMNKRKHNENPRSSSTPQFKKVVSNDVKPFSTPQVKRSNSNNEPGNDRNSGPLQQQLSSDIDCKKRINKDQGKMTEKEDGLLIQRLQEDVEEKRRALLIYLDAQKTVLQEGGPMSNEASRAESKILSQKYDDLKRTEEKLIRETKRIEKKHTSSEKETLFQRFTQRKTRLIICVVISVVLLLAALYYALSHYDSSTSQYKWNANVVVRPPNKDFKVKDNKKDNKTILRMSKFMQAARRSRGEQWMKSVDVPIRRRDVSSNDSRIYDYLRFYREKNKEKI